jgi:hypothetical protein
MILKRKNYNFQIEYKILLFNLAFIFVSTPVLSQNFTFKTFEKVKIVNKDTFKYTGTHFIDDFNDTIFVGFCSEYINNKLHNKYAYHIDSSFFLMNYEKNIYDSLNKQINQLYINTSYDSLIFSYSKKLNLNKVRKIFVITSSKIPILYYHNSKYRKNPIILKDKYFLIENYDNGCIKSKYSLKKGRINGKYWLYNKKGKLIREGME